MKPQRPTTEERISSSSPCKRKSVSRKVIVSTKWQFVTHATELVALGDDPT
jgi:hypothetical protein